MMQVKKDCVRVPAVKQFHIQIKKDEKILVLFAIQARLCGSHGKDNGQLSPAS